MSGERALSTGELARALSVSASAVLKWQRAGLIVPDLTTPGGHHRWNLQVVRRQLREARENQRNHADTDDEPGPDGTG